MRALRPRRERGASSFGFAFTRRNVLVVSEAPSSSVSSYRFNEGSATPRLVTASLPNGQGIDFPDAAGHAVLTGTAPNELTSLDDRDAFAGTPWHKWVPARIEAL